jgi:hypothetical protein
MWYKKSINFYESANSWRKSFIVLSLRDALKFGLRPDKECKIWRGWRRRAITKIKFSVKLLKGDDIARKLVVQDITPGN